MSVQSRPTRQTEVNTQAIRLALHHLKRLKRAYAEYEEEVDAWYRSGEGRSPKWITEFSPDGEPYQVNVGGHGYRFPQCIHGSSLWTDYDNICGPCEDSLTLYEQALILGHDDWTEWMRRVEVCTQTSLARVPDEIQQQLVQWALSILPKE